MQNDSIDNLRLDLNKKSVRGVFYVRSGDTRARTIHITLTNNGSVVDLSDAYICELLILKPDGSQNDQAMVRYGNELQYTFRTQDINVPGECKCQIMVTFNDAAVVTSPEFSVMVYQKEVDQELERSTNEYTAISQQLADAIALGNQTVQDADRAETARQSVEGAEAICQQYAESASDSAASASLSADNADDSADSAEASMNLAKEYRDDAETFMEETRTNLQSVEDKATEILNYDTSAQESAEAAAASADAASDSEDAAESSAEDSEAYAVGTRGGVDVVDTDPTYHNNSKYYAAQAEAAVVNTVRSFNGRTGAVVPTDGDYDLEGLSDVNLTSPTDGQGLRYDAESGKWVNGDAASAVSNLTDVDLDNLANGQVLKYNSTSQKWVNAQDSAGHVVEDSAGTDMTQRSNLQFADAYITDDSTNDRTKVENIKECLSTDLASMGDGIIITTDEEDIPIGDIEEDYVEVVADGVKTRADLLTELDGLVDWSKINENSYIVFGNDIYRVNVPNVKIFMTSAISNGHLYNTMLDLKYHTSQQYVTTSNGSTLTDNSSAVPTNGRTITLYYGSSVTTVNLQIDARHCMMSDGETSVADVVDCDKTTAGTYALKCTVDAQGNNTYSWV